MGCFVFKRSGRVRREATKKKDPFRSPLRRWVLQYRFNNNFPGVLSLKCSAILHLAVFTVERYCVRSRGCYSFVRNVTSNFRITFRSPVSFAQDCCFTEDKECLIIGFCCYYFNNASTHVSHTNCREAGCNPLR
jgi:hypothetical protein